MLFWLLGCTISKPLPNLGDCATYSSDGYDYGTIGIGTCIAGATDLAFRTDENGELYLLVSNANPYVNFDGGSLLSIPWRNVNTETPRLLSHQLETNVLALPDFAGNMAFTADEIAMVTVRYSEDSRTRTDADDIHLIDLSDPSSPTWSTRGTNGGHLIEVSSDPVDIAIDQSTGMAFVGNRTSHDISIINSTRDPMLVIPPWPLEVLGEAQFVDADSSGSLASLSRLETLDTFYADTLDSEEIADLANLTDDYWTLDWLEGTWDLWLPQTTDNGYQRFNSIDARNLSAQGIGDEFSQIESLLGQSVTDLFIWGAEAYFVLEGQDSVAAADWNAANYEWVLRDASTLSADGLSLSSPSLVVVDETLWMVVLVTERLEDGTEDRWIASATQDAGGNWRLQDRLVSVDDGTLLDTTVVEEFGIGQWRIFATVETDLGTEIRQWRSNDWSTWTPATTIADDFLDIGAPVVSEESDRFRMWYAIGTENIWDIAYAESIDGEYWESFGVVSSLSLESDRPPRIGLQATPISSFRLEGESAGYQGTVEVGETAVLDTQGWALTVATGQWLDTDQFGANSAGGLYIADQIDNTFVIAMTDAGGASRIGFLDETGNQGIWIEPTDDVTSVESPVVWQDNIGWNLAYTEVRDNQYKIVQRTSSDGETWSDATVILEPHDDWASVQVQPSDWLLVDDVPTLLYAGFDDSTWSIGQATFTDGTWTTSDTPWFDLGRPGSWDDSGVRDAKIQLENNTYRLWYAGFDGDQWRIGSSTSTSLEIGATWTRSETATLDNGWFHSDGVQHPLPSYEDGQWFLYYAGFMDTVARVGQAIGSAPTAMRPIYRYPTLGDQIYFETQKGDAEGNTIPLETSVTDTTTFGIGLTDISIDSERGFLYASSKLMPHVSVIDIRDDSQGDFVDRNYLDEEARLILPTSMGSAGFRQVLPHPDGQHILAIGDSPEAVYIIDMTAVVDDAQTDRLYDLQSSWLPLPVGGEDDAGERTRTSMGPGTMLIDEVHNRLFVSNFNANSISVFDLSVQNGVQIAEIDTWGENPYAMALTPDAGTLVVSNYTGDVVENVAHGTLSVIDVNPLSESVYTVQTQVVNQ